MHATRRKDDSAFVAAHVASRRGFSLVELLIVVAILGILSFAAIPYLSSDVPQQLQMVADAVVGDCEYVRGLAVANNSSYRITFNLAQNSYTFQHTGAVAGLNKLPSSPYHTTSTDGTQQTAELSKLPMVAGAVKIAAVQKNPASPSDVTDLEFGPQGSTSRSEASLIWLVSSSSGTKMYIPITINATTGLVDVGDIQSTTPTGVTP